jgi:dTDP-4-amino-4,6-dideoxygalactose transaminase
MMSRLPFSCGTEPTREGTHGRCDAKAESVFQVIDTFMARDALALALTHLGLGVGDTVLLPVYTCQEVLRSFANRVNIAFYDIGPDLCVQPDEIRRRLARSGAKMALIIDYFGFLQPHRRAIRDICDSRGVCLIEDCAHSLLTEGSGEVGHFAIYSFRKLLPLTDGGALKVNCGPAPDQPAYYPRMYSDALSLVALAKSWLNVKTTLLSRSNVASHTTGVIAAIAPRRRRQRTLPVSHFAESRMANLAVSEIIKRRRDDFRFWLDVTATGGAFVPIHSELPSSVCPLGFPLALKNGDRVGFESRARKAGIRLSVHWRLDPTFGSDCRVSHELSKQIVTLPVYPDIDARKRDTLARLLSWSDGRA